MPRSSRIHRRDILSSGLLAGTSAIFGSLPAVQAAQRPSAVPASCLRIAHLTDIHLQPELAAAKGLIACFEHVQSLPQRLGCEGPNIILTGGDTIMDAMAADVARTQLQWELWRKIKADHCGIEVQSVVGNHDVWGWTKTAARATGDEPLYGKRWVCDEFGRDMPYKSFDRAGWHIVILDSIFPFEETYIGKLDDAQWDWLERDVAAVPPATRIILFSHIPILSSTPFTTVKPTAPHATDKPVYGVEGSYVHVDIGRFQSLFAKHPNVKACVSGHMHLVEQIDFAGVRYLCNGAVSAGWWKGKHKDTDFGYALVDLFDDGSVERRYVPYGWTAST